MKFTKILSCLLLLFSFSAPSITAGTNGYRFIDAKYKTKRPSVYDSSFYEVALQQANDEFSLDFTMPQGLAEISICDEKGNVIESFTASTDAQIVWYMTDYEGCTLTITTEYAEYTAEL